VAFYSVSINKLDARTQRLDTKMERRKVFVCIFVKLRKRIAEEYLSWSTYFQCFKNVQKKDRGPRAHGTTPPRGS